MFYGYENPVEMPISELFDTGLMNAYTQAVKAEYEKGERDWTTLYLNMEILDHLLQKI